MERRIKRMFTSFLRQLFLIFMVSTSVLAQEPSRCWDKFQFEGNETFSSKQLRDALIAEPDFLLATHPLSDQADVGNVIERLLFNGYRSMGFVNPVVKTERHSDGTVSTSIEEGKRIRCGSVQIINAKEINVNHLVERLTKPYPPENAYPTNGDIAGQATIRWLDETGSPIEFEKPIWQKGAYVNFDVDNKLSSSVKAALKDLGWSNAKFSLKIDTSADDGNGNLIVQIYDEEKADQVESVSITGSEINTAKELKAFLDLQPKFDWNVAMFQRISKQLWDCGRFSKHNLRFDRDENGRGRLAIELVDVPNVPPIDEPISEAAEILLRARRWLNSVNEQGRDIALTLQNEIGRFHCILSTLGTAVEFVPKPELESPHDAVEDRLHIVIDHSRIAIGHHQNPNCLIADTSLFPGAIRIESKIASFETEEHFASFHLSGRCQSTRTFDAALFSHIVNISPSDWIGFAYKDNPSPKIHDNRLTFTRDSEVLEIDVHTGEIYRWESDFFKIAFHVGLFDQFRSDAMLALVGKSNQFDPSRPLTSFTNWLLNERTWSEVDNVRQLIFSTEPSLDPHLRTSFEKLVKGGLLDPLDDFACSIASEDSDRDFHIPNNDDSQSAWQNFMGYFVAKPLLKFAPDLFAEGTWPMTILRETSLVMLNRGTHTTRVLKSLHEASTNGPICDATLACLLSLTPEKNGSAAFARSSLEKLNSARFDQDVHTLLSGKVGRWISDVLNAIATLNADEVESLVQWMPNEETANFLRDVYQRSSQSLSKSPWLEAGRSGLENFLEGIIRR